MTMYRQGDVLLVRRTAKPRNARPVERDNGRIVLAEGEATGHAHAIWDPEVDLVETANARYLYVEGDTAELVHEEHATITLSTGVYEVIRQREFRFGGGGSFGWIQD